MSDFEKKLKDIRQKIKKSREAKLEPRVARAIKRLIITRQVFQWTTTALADALEISQSGISKLESFAVEPKISRILEICDIFEIPPYLLFMDPPKKFKVDEDWWIETLMEAFDDSDEIYGLIKDYCKTYH